mmetsp:Transcript_5548/g.19857  ORF Transcript_5548/g.19857 Transcript_5548/m.19857 type:complete len:220 (-) Transcript_5548:572-1231(-)
MWRQTRRSAQDVIPPPTVRRPAMAAVTTMAALAALVPRTTILATAATTTMTRTTTRGLRILRRQWMPQRRPPATRAAMTTPSSLLRPAWRRRLPSRFPSTPLTTTTASSTGWTLARTPRACVVSCGTTAAGCASCSRTTTRVCRVGRGSTHTTLHRSCRACATLRRAAGCRRHSASSSVPSRTRRERVLRWARRSFRCTSYWRSCRLPAATSCLSPTDA